METEIKKAAAMLGRKGGKKSSSSLKMRLGQKKTSQHFSDLVRRRWDRLNASKAKNGAQTQGSRRPSKTS